MWKNKNLTSLLVLFLLIAFGSILAQDNDPVKSGNRIRKKTSFADEGVGVQTKGQLQNLTMNYGQLSDTRYEDRGNAPTDLFFNYRYPKENFTGLVDDFSLFFAIKQNSKNGDQGNVVDAWTDNDNEDFIAKDGSYGKTHYNKAVDPTPHDEILYNGTTPYLAHSDLKDTWPVDALGEPFWPGIFRRDPVTGIEIPGEFASDRDIYMEYNDNNNQDGNVIGIEVNEMAYSYGRVYADNVLFYELWIINKSGAPLNGCYVGFYQDPDCSDYGQEILQVVDSTYPDGSKLFSLAQRDYDGDIGGATVPNSLGIAEDQTFGTIVLETPYNLGITDFHYFVDPGPVDDHRLWPIISSDPTNPNISGEAASYFHGTDTRKDDVNTIVPNLDLAWIISSGPFNMTAGDTVKLTVAVAVGDDDAHYYRVLDQAKTLFDAKFNGPIAPPAPNLSVVPGDGEITLYWDDSPENFIDPSSGENDFEGYKIYKSEDGGLTWGTKITDSQGRTYGYVPVAQFDIDNNISGVDPINPLVYLGNNTGLKHSWTDKNVVNGMSYSYTIVSYDRGTSTLFSLETVRGDGPQVQNFVNVIPTPKAVGILPGAVKTFSKFSGTGEGEVSISIIDQDYLTNADYEIRMEGSPSKFFSVIRKDNTDVVLYDSKPINETDLPVIDGFKVSINNDDRIGGLKSINDQEGKSVDGVNNVSSDSSWYVTAALFSQADTLAKTSTYEIRFDGSNTVAYSWGLTGSVAKYTVPFSITNITTTEKVAFEIRDLNNNNEWDEGETIFITTAPYPDPSPAMGSLNPATSGTQFAYQVSIINAPGSAPGTPPATGTVIQLASYNPLKQGDVFRFSFELETFDKNLTDLSKIRVVPNPYIVVSKFENMQNVREIKFMYLPPECTIKIFTIAGELVKTIEHKSSDGSLSWNLLTDWNQALSFGVYVYVVEDPFGNKHIDKFALIK